MTKEDSFKEKALELTAREYIIWFTTTSRNLSPQPRPVWFIWHDDHFLIYSQPNTNKIRHIQERPNVSLNFNSDREADNDVVFLKGVARIAPEIAPANELPAYTKKYAEGFTSIGMTAEEFAKSYSTPILVNVSELEGMG